MMWGHCPHFSKGKEIQLMDREQAINIALKEGAYKAAVIPVEQVI